METETFNAKITGTILENKDRGILTLWISLEFDGGGQGYGGYALDQWDEKKKERIGTDYGCQCIINLLNTFDVINWSKLENIYCRVEREEGWSGKILRIGHVVEDRWFSFEDTLKGM